MKSFRKVMKYVVGLCLLPVIALAIAIIGAKLTGCDVDEGGVHGCVIGGINIGDVLSALGLGGYFMLYTIPLLALAGLIWFAVEAFNWVRSRQALS